jgi:hypothetical protein
LCSRLFAELATVQRRAVSKLLEDSQGVYPFARNWDLDGP